MSEFVASCDKPGENMRFRTRAVEWWGKRSDASMSVDVNSLEGPGVRHVAGFALLLRRSVTLRDQRRVELG